MVTIKDNAAEFRWFRPHAQTVHVVGDFNRWDRRSLPMSRQADGNWVLRLPLPEGMFQFRYLADGHWFTDYAAFGVEPGPLGTNSVLRITHSAAPAPCGRRHCPAVATRQ
jgi:1,4-alpha-glucan branching enzyme